MLVERPSHIQVKFWTLENARKVDKINKEISNELDKETG